MKGQEEQGLLGDLPVDRPESRVRYRSDGCA